MAPWWVTPSEILDAERVVLVTGIAARKDLVYSSR